MDLSCTWHDLVSRVPRSPFCDDSGHSGKRGLSSEVQMGRRRRRPRQCFARVNQEGVVRCSGSEGLRTARRDRAGSAERGAPAL